MTYSASEVMTIAAARALRNNDICFVGIGMPSAACNLARLTHAPDLTLIYESGTIATKPDVLPLSTGDGGAPEISSACGEIFIIMRQAPRSFVEKLDFFTSFGHGEGGDHRARMGLATKGPTKLVTDLAIFEPDPVTKEMTVTSIHPGVTRDAIKANTGWPVRYAADVAGTPAPTEQELSVLRELHARTSRAHGDAA